MTLLEDYLKPVPTSPGVTSREIVRRAIEFADPPRIPYSFIMPFESDFLELSVVKSLASEVPGDPPRPGLGEVYTDQWGVGWRVTGRGWDHAFDHPLKDLRNLDSYEFPDVAGPDQFAWAEPYIRQARRVGKYVVGFDPIEMYGRMRALMGFEELMVAPYAQPEGLHALLDRLTALTVTVIEQWATIGGVDGYMTWEDWGLQTSLQMKVKTFREFYKPRYARIVETAHRNGLHYFWHNCGYILDMIPDMIEIGVDVVQLDQPRLMGHHKLTELFGGRICFWNTVDIQWSTRGGVTDDDIRAEVVDMVAGFDRFNGGFIARQYPQPWDIDLSYEHNMAIYEAFMENGCRV
jgi:uroporphyrinogen decarboxylase